ncbi:MAG TPA: type II secretion system protein N [Myxococcota bacterium]|nr:type II secretion system protein N [Myxococcota bacterium]
MAARSPRRTLLALSACLLLALALAWALGRRPGQQGPPSPAVAARELPDVATPPPAAGPPAVSERAADDDAIPNTRLPLHLLATVVSEKPAASLATVEDIERSATEVMNEGERFEGRPKVQIARIERARILIDNDGVREQLVITQGAAPEAAYVSPEEREHRRDLSRRLRELTDAGTNYRDVLGEGRREGLLGEGDVSAVYEDEKLVGVQFDSIREGGFYDQIGLKNGDVVTEINGVSVSDPAAMVKVIGQFVGSDELDIAVERGGAPQRLVVSTPPLRKTAEGLAPPPPE